MPKLNHIACIAQDAITVAKFYSKIFHMSFHPQASRLGWAATAREGYVGLNFNPMMPGRPGPIGLDHFGIEVEDINQSFKNAREKYPEVDWVKRSGTRPYAQVGIHDPDGQVVDINQKNMDESVSEVKTGGLYLEEDTVQERRVDHLCLRTPDPARCSDFYQDVFEMTPLNRAEEDETYSLTDGQVTLRLLPWKIEDYDGLPANRPMLDHIGFRVEDAGAVHREILDYNAEFPPGAAPCWLLEGRAQDIARRDQLRRAAPESQYQYCDANGVCFVTVD